jgi:hypothetical protein
MTTEASCSDVANGHIVQLERHSKFKRRSYDTHYNVHLPELNARLELGLSLASEDDSAHQTPDLFNTSKIEVVYLGNSMLERLKTTGKATNLSTLDAGWNAGCGGDKNENVIYRLEKGLYDILTSAHENKPDKCGIKMWILASGTNNLHTKRGFRTADIDSWKVLVEACLRAAPGSVVLACDVFYRKDIMDSVVDEGNELLRKVVEQTNDNASNAGEITYQGSKERVKWIEARHLISKDLLDDHVHLNEEGYRVWDRVLWPHVAEALGLEK